jgi:hypothetical protein
MPMELEVFVTPLFLCSTCPNLTFLPIGICFCESSKIAIIHPWWSIRKKSKIFRDRIWNPHGVLIMLYTLFSSLAVNRSRNLTNHTRWGSSVYKVHKKWNWVSFILLSENLRNRQTRFKNTTLCAYCVICFVLNVSLDLCCLEFCGCE